MKTEHEMYDLLSTKFIAERLDIPVPTLVKVLSKLTAANLIQAKEGAKGGILLAKSITDITLLDVFEAVEQGKPLFKIHTDFMNEYESVNLIKEKGIKCLKEAEEAMKLSLKNASLLDLLK
jgi:Rrf2 family protein